MYLNRIYDHSSGAPKVAGVKVLRSGREQKFSPRVIDGGVAEGWLSMGAGKLTIHGESGDLVYSIMRVPGYYCCHCEQKLDGEQDAKGHIGRAHPGKPSPDADNPAGYRRDNFYFCVNESAPEKPTHPKRSSWINRLKGWR